jgi:hypothetical protein
VRSAIIPATCVPRRDGEGGGRVVEGGGLNGGAEGGEGGKEKGSGRGRRGTSDLAGCLLRTDRQCVSG